MKNFKLRLTILTLAVFASFNYNATSQGDELTWNGSISSDWNNSNNWTPNTIPTETSEIIIPETSNRPLILGVISIKDLNINSGSTVTIPVGATLNINGDLTMDSDSNSYSGLIVKGTITITGTAKYHRFTNSQANGNDLIAPPFSGQSWSSFLTNDTNYNEGIIFNNSVQPMTTYLFGPFEKSSTDDYILFDDNSTEVLISGKGYRAATNTGNGDALIFTGTILTGNHTTTIVDDLTGVASEWNLIGNPYPAYLDVDAFLNHVGSESGVTNLSLLSASTAAIYGYNANTSDSGNIWTIANLASETTLIAPGQGFFVSSSLPSANLEFTPEMQVVGNDDDFIQGRLSEPNKFVRIQMHAVGNSYETSVYFHENGTNGLDIGYDAAIFESNLPDFVLYTKLLQDYEDLPFVIQTLNSSVIENVSVPLGVNANQGQQLTFNIDDSYLPASINVYLEDNLTGAFTLLNSSNYTFTTSTTISGTGRFFLHFTTSDFALSLEETSLNNLNIYANQANRTIVTEGVLIGKTEASIYDLLGRKVLQQELDQNVTKHVISTNSLSAGVYLVKLQNGTQQKSKKVILR